MDSLTQAALGAVVGERLLGRQLGRSAIGWGALVGTLPDLDILVYPWLDEIAQLYWHRGFSHSVFGVLVGTPLVAWILYRWWNRKNATGGDVGGLAVVSFRRALVFVSLNFVTHILIDLFTVYGTQLLDPLSLRRFALNNFFIIDPLFTLPLWIWIGAALFRKKVPGRAAPGWALGCAMAVAGYVAFSFAAQAAAAQRFERELAAAGIEPVRSEISAAPLTTLIWRGLFETEDAFWISYWALTDCDEPLVFHRVPRGIDQLDLHRGDRAIDCALWFSEEYLLVEPDPDSAGFLVTDLRFGEFWPDDSGGLPRTFFRWRVVPASDRGPAVLEAARGSSSLDIGRALGQLVARLRGDRLALGPAAASAEN